MYYLSSLRIENYRSFKEADFSLSEITPIVGYNNGGKTNFLRAVSWLVNRTGLLETDYYDPQKPVEITATISGVSQQILEKLGEKHRPRVEPFIVDEKLTVKRVQESPGQGATKAILHVLKPGEDGEAWQPNPSGIDQALKAIFPNVIEIEAMQDLAEELAKSKTTSTIGKLVKMILSPIEEGYRDEFNTALQEFVGRFDVEGQERIEELQRFDERASVYLRELFPGISIRLGVNAPELASVLSQGKVVIKEDDRGEEWKDIQTFGHGAQRSVQIALLRYIAEYQTEETNEGGSVFLIDQPELYMHPHAIEQIRIALRILAEKGYQVIFTTHSPLMISEADILESIILVKDVDSGSHPRKKVREVIDTIKERESQAETLFELSNSSEFLFAEKVICFEGQTERAILPAIYQRFQKSTFARDKIGLVMLRGVGGVNHCLEILNQMGFPACALVDLDFAFRRAIQAGLVTNDDDQIETCREILKRLSETHDFHLADDGFPKKGGALSPAEALNIFASEEDAKELIDNFHTRFKEVGIWMLRGGDFDHHVGLAKKDRKHWLGLTTRISELQSEKVREEFSEVCEFLDWAKGIN